MVDNSGNTQTNYQSKTEWAKGGEGSYGTGQTWYISLKESYDRLLRSFQDIATYELNGMLTWHLQHYFAAKKPSLGQMVKHSKHQTQHSS